MIATYKAGCTMRKDSQTYPDKCEGGISTMVRCDQASKDRDVFHARSLRAPVHLTGCPAHPLLFPGRRRRQE
eukprot:2225184-Pyramimonas_sp.AAC.1